MVTVQNLIMRYGNRVLFQDINLKLDRHKRYGLIGANGAGKTTFLNIFIFFVYFDSLNSIFGLCR